MAPLSKQISSEISDLDSDTSWIEVKCISSGERSSFSSEPFLASLRVFTVVCSCSPWICFQISYGVRFKLSSTRYSSTSLVPCSQVLKMIIYSGIKMDFRQVRPLGGTVNCTLVSFTTSLEPPIGTFKGLTYLVLGKYCHCYSSMEFYVVLMFLSSEKDFTAGKKAFALAWPHNKDLISKAFRLVVSSHCDMKVLLLKVVEYSRPQGSDLRCYVTTECYSFVELYSFMEIYYVVKFELLNFFLSEDRMDARKKPLKLRWIITFKVATDCALKTARIAVDYVGAVTQMLFSEA